MAVAGITALVSAVKSLSQASINNYAHFEKLEMGLTTFFQSADKGKSKFEELRKLSNETTFGVDELTDSFTQLANVGVNVDSIKDRLTILGDLAQGDKAKFAELTSIYAKINSVGKAGSMQLQQIATKGIPIYDILKKIGVQGTATADDITKAFKMMTDEGSQFYNAMNNINETIEGKQGFISDYLKEMSVNFAEVTGLADIYKNTLDILKEAIGAVSDKLLEWSKDPVMKAIISGLFVGAIASIVTALLTSLIPTLGKVITKLTTIKILEGPKGWATLAVAGIAVAVGAYASYSRSLNKAEEDNKKLLDAVEKTKKAMGNDYKLLNVGVDTGNTAIKSRDSTKNTLEAYKKNLAGFEEELEKAHKAVSDIEEKIRADGGGGLTGYENQLKRAQAEVDKWRESIAHTNKSIEEQTRLLNYWEGEVQKLDISTLTAEFEKIHEGTISKESQKLSALQSQMDTVLAYQKKMQELDGKKDASGNIISYEKAKPEIDETVQYLQDKLSEVRLKIKIANLEDWQRVLQKSMGFSDEQVGEGYVDKGAVAVEKFKEKLEKEQANMKSFSDKGLINISNLELAEYKLEQIQTVIKAIQESGQWGADEKTVQDMQALQQSAISDVYAERMTNAQNELAILKDQTGELQKQYELKMLTDQGFDIEQAQALLDIEKEKSDLLLLQSDAWSYLTQKLEEFGSKEININDLGKAFSNTLKEIAKTELPSMLVSGFETIGKALAEGADAGSEMKKQFAQMIAQMLKSLASACITAGVNLIAQSGWAGVPPALALFALGGASGLASGFIGSLAEGGKESDEQAKQLELLKSLNKQYEDLRDAMREQEEYYIKKKHELNMYALDDRTTSVNDMIITPNGKFSTHPDDYLIATKNPQNLNGGVTNNIKVINNAGVDVDVSERRSENGMNEILVTLSKKIASDVANGYNGWDSAFAMQKQRVDGRRI